MHYEKGLCWLWSWFGPFKRLTLDRFSYCNVTQSSNQILVYHFLPRVYMSFSTWVVDVLFFYYTNRLNQPPKHIQPKTKRNESTSIVQTVQTSSTQYQWKNMISCQSFFFFLWSATSWDRNSNSWPLDQIQLSIITELNSCQLPLNSCSRFRSKLELMELGKSPPCQFERAQNE